MPGPAAPAGLRSPGRPPAPGEQAGLQRKGPPRPSNLLCPGDSSPAKQLTLGGAFCGQAHPFFEKVSLFPHSLKDKVMQRNTNGTATTRAVACRSDLIDEISSYRIILLWFPSELLIQCLIISSEK